MKFLFFSVVVIISTAILSCNGNKPRLVNGDTLQNESTDPQFPPIGDLDYDGSQQILISFENYVNQEDFKSAGEVIDSLLLDKAEDKVRDEILKKFKKILSEHATEFEQADNDSPYEAAEKTMQYHNRIADRVAHLTRDDFKGTDLQSALVEKLSHGQGLAKLRTTLMLSYNVPDLHHWLNNMSDNNIITPADRDKYVPLCTCTEP